MKLIKKKFILQCFITIAIAFFNAACSKNKTEASATENTGSPFHMIDVQKDYDLKSESYLVTTPVEFDKKPVRIEIRLKNHDQTGTFSYTVFKSIYEAYVIEQTINWKLKEDGKWELFSRENNSISAILTAQNSQRKSFLLKVNKHESNKSLEENVFEMTYTKTILTEMQN